MADTINHNGGNGRGHSSERCVSTPSRAADHIEGRLDMADALTVLKDWEIRGATVFKGHEGENCFAGHLHFEGEAVAHWSDSATGGEMAISFFDPASEGYFYAALENMDPMELDGIMFVPSPWLAVQVLLEKQPVASLHMSDVR